MQERNTMQQITVALIVIAVLVSGLSYMNGQTINSNIAKLTGSTEDLESKLSDTAGVIGDLADVVGVLGESMGEIGESMGAYGEEIAAILEKIEALEEAIEVKPAIDSDKDGVPDNLDEFPGRDDELFKTTLVIGSKYAASELDPALNVWTSGLCVARQIYEKLVDYDENGNVVPHLATSWEISDDGLEYTFYLEEGVTFHDGSIFDASAVKFGYDRMATIQKGPYAVFSMIDEVEVKGDYIVTFKLKNAYAPFLSFLAYYSGSQIVSPTAVMLHEKDGDFGQEWLHINAVGTGPYKLVKFDAENEIILEAFDDYWQGWEGNHIETVVFKTIREAATQKMMLIEGDLDYAEKILEGDYDDVNAAGTGAFIEPHMESVWSVGCIWMNNQRWPTNITDVRKAIAYSINYDKIQNNLFPNYPSPKGPLAPTFPGANPDVFTYTYDPVKAQQLLVDAGYPDGLGITVEYTYDLGADPYRIVGEQLASDLLPLGITVQVIGQTSAVSMEVGSNPETQTIFDHIRVYGFVADPDYIFTQWYHSLATKGRGHNWGYYENPEVDDLIEKARVETDPEIREDLYYQIQDKIMEDCPIIQYALLPEAYGQREWLKGVTYLPAFTRTLWIYGCYKEGIPGGE